MTRTGKLIIGVTALVFLLLWMPASSVWAADPAPHGTTDAGHGTEAGDHGKPSLFAKPAAGIIPAVTTLVVFVCLMLVLGKFAWGPIASGLKAREDKIRNDINEAEAARVKAEATLKEYSAKLAAAEDRIREMLGNATVEGEKLATSIRMKGQAEAEEIKERANKDIEAARDAALREIYERTADLATSVAERIIRRNLNPADQQDLVRQSLEQLKAVER